MQVTLLVNALAQTLQTIPHLQVLLGLQASRQGDVVADLRSVRLQRTQHACAVAVTFESWRSQAAWHHDATARTRFWWGIFWGSAGP